MAEIDHSPVSFAEWSTVLAGESFDPATRERYRRCIVAYLHHLKERRERASVASAKAYVESGETQGVTDQLDRDALRWFFLAARRRDPVAGGKLSVEEQASPIHPEKADTGKTPWERRLVERLRVGQYQWRTEVTYRDWAWRFAVWLGARPLDGATGEDLKDFLTHLAVDRAVAASTQRQALNALIFLFREVLGRDPGDVSDYTPSRRRWSTRFQKQVSAGSGSGYFPPASCRWILRPACSGGIMCRMRRSSTRSARRPAAPDWISV